MIKFILTTICLLPLCDIQDDSVSTVQSHEGIEVKLDGLELSRFGSELVPSTEQLVPKIKRAIVLTTSISGSNETAAPRIRLANGNLIDLKIHGNTLRRGVLGIKGSDGTNEAWFEIDQKLPLDQIFPCTVVIGVKSKDGQWIKFSFENISP
jgi:hypothetical protein